MNKDMLDAEYFRTVRIGRGWFARNVLHRRANRKLAALFDGVPVGAGKEADEWMLRCLEWVWRYVVPRERDPLAPKPTSGEVLECMATHCEGYAALIVDMAHAALDPVAWPRIRYVTGYKQGYRHHAWAQWRDSKGCEWMLDAGRSREPFMGTNGWTIDAEEITITRPVE
jgi:hypothetical protein